MDDFDRRRKMGEVGYHVFDPNPQKRRKGDDQQQSNRLQHPIEGKVDCRSPQPLSISLVSSESEEISQFDRLLDKKFNSSPNSHSLSQSQSAKRQDTSRNRMESYEFDSPSKKKDPKSKSNSKAAHISKNEEQRDEESYIRSISKTTKTEKSTPSKRGPVKPVKYDTHDNPSPYKRQQKPQKSSASKQGKSMKIGDPPSNSRSNVVVTRGVDFVPVDNYFSRREEAKVLEFHKAFYSITLSQSNLAKDDNKFFIIQLLIIGNPPDQEYFLFSRWGRVGVIGQISENGPLSRKEAIRQYNAKSQGKVNHGGYRIVEMSYEQDQQIEQKELQEIDQYLAKENSTLPQQVEDLMKLIFDNKMMQTHMREIGYDEKRSPLGLIARSAIEKGYIALDKVLKVLKMEATDSERRNLLNEHSSQFYSVIPHDFGYLNMRAFVLNSEEKVKEKLEMLSSLSQIQIYSNLMNEKAIDDQLPDLDKKYSKLKCEITPLQKDAAIYPILIQYLKNTHAKTHDKYTIELIDIFTLRRPQESEKFIDSLGNKMLLWHGSRLTNYVGILSEGLKIAPYEAPSTGYMFGKGIYFADIASKSANYCLPKHNSSGLLLLCEVALGEMNDKFASDYTAHNLPPAKQSTRGVGKFAPSKGVMVDGVLIPNGQLEATGIEESSLLYNEYVVYSREQIQCRYIVQVNFILKR